ncbi:arsenical resistance operon repressor [Geobacter sp. OR-1]|uniref:ArsR/SmtB family transcription factor n=1 Tax=Geobacter sp. OR-1 TaxID=1266765 RepID=UPI000543A192|nr:metalloregulator ArsR/SmtB family transcription factor [Geobacter sp. OR-1]GAM10851.1 arsenical resistance operon repressor [Geobacter sp. OR-1]
MEQFAQIFKSLSDPIRLRIVMLLQNEGELCVCDLMAVLGLPQSTVSRHLAYLKRNGWVSDRRQGIWMKYRVSSDCSPLCTDLMKSLLRHAAESHEAERDRSSLESFLKAKSRPCQ